MKMYLKIIVILIISIIIYGCESSVLDEKPPHLITAETLYTSVEGLETGLNGAYSIVRREHGGGINFYAQMFQSGTDNLTANWNQGFNLAVGTSWGGNNHPSNNYFPRVFNWLYELINATNTIIYRAELNLPESTDRQRIIAEARAIRAWAYRHLSFSWGDVPLALNESQGSTIRTDWERDPVLEVRKQIIADLLFAEKHITVEPSLPGRLTKGAVQHYLAEMYLVLKKPDSTLYWAEKAINNPAYTLITDRYGVNINQPGVPFSDMFQDGNRNREEGNSEALWVWQFAYNIPGGGSGAETRADHLGRYMDMVVNGITPLQITHDRGGRGKSYTAPTKFAIELYGPNDDRGSNHILRKFLILRDAAGNAPYPADRLPSGYQYGDTIWFNWNVDLSPQTWRQASWPYSRKVEGTDPNNVTMSPNYENYIALRLADTYLLKAEAEYLLGRPGDAAETINVIRRRSNAGDITAADVNIDFILDERSRELFLEEHRRYTLLRTGKWYERTKAHNKFGGQHITLRDTLFPIPQIVIDANITRVMPQNPGFDDF
jgi:starch-binding outer membrane protein, SusD/RagB family